jgi:hypothetical protein
MSSGRESANGSLEELHKLLDRLTGAPQKIILNRHDAIDIYRSIGREDCARFIEMNCPSNCLVVIEAGEPIRFMRVDDEAE